MCSQRWVRLENFSFPNFFPCRNFHFGIPQISVVQNMTSKKKKKKKKKNLSLFLSPSILSFPPLLSFTISSQTFQGWATCPPCPPLVTPLKRYVKHNETLWTTDFFNSVFCLVSCSSKNQVPYFKAVADSNLTRLLLRKKKKKKKNV